MLAPPRRAGGGSTPCDHARRAIRRAEELVHRGRERSTARLPAAGRIPVTRGIWPIARHEENRELCPTPPKHCGWNSGDTILIAAAVPPGRPLG